MPVPIRADLTSQASLVRCRETTILTQTSQSNTSANEDNSFRFVGYDFEVLAKDLVGDMIEDKTALAERLDDAYTYHFDKDTNEIWFNVLQSDSSDSAEFVIPMQLGGDKQSVTFLNKTYNCTVTITAHLIYTVCRFWYRRGNLWAV